MAKRIKKDVEILLAEAKLTALPERRLMRMRSLVCVDLVWPRTGIARKSAAREVAFRKGAAEFGGEPWAKRLVFREEIEGHAAFAVSVTEPVTVQKLRRFARLTAKYALRMGADFMEKAMVGYADIASAPIDALSAMIGEKDAPKAVAQGVVDLEELPGEGEEMRVEIPLRRPGESEGEPVGALVLVVRG